MISMIAGESRNEEGDDRSSHVGGTRGDDVTG